MTTTGYDYPKDDEAHRLMAEAPDALLARFGRVATYRSVEDWQQPRRLMGTTAADLFDPRETKPKPWTREDAP